MYLPKSSRQACWILVVLGALLTVPALIVLVREGPSKGAGLPLTCAGLLFLLPGMVPLALYDASDASRFRPQRDVLRADLGLSGFLEVGGVQHKAIVYPDEIAPPSVVLVALFLQNAHASPREVVIDDVQGPLWLLEPAPFRVRLEGGECGALHMAGEVEANAAQGPHEIRYKIRVSRPDGIGSRVIAEEARGGFTAFSHASYPIVMVAPGAPDDPRVRFANLRALAGWRPVFKPGMAAPAESALDFLNVKE